MSVNEKAELIGQYLEKLRSERVVFKYPFLFEFAWAMYREKGDKDKAYEIWKQMSYEQISGLFDFLHEYSPYNVSKDDLIDFDKFLKDYIK